MGNTQKNIYNSKGNLIEKDTYNPSGKLVEKDLYTFAYGKNNITEKDFYSSSGVITEKDSYDYNGNTTAIALYDNKGNLSSKYLYNSTGQLNEYDAYNADGTLSGSYIYKNWVLSSGTCYKYDSNKNIIEKDIITGNYISEKDFYNSKGTITEKDVFISNNLSSKSFYTNGIMSEIDYYTKGVITQKNFYDSHGNLIVNSGIVTTDPNGNKVVDYGQASSWANYLDHSQGDNDKGYKYDCGLVSCENVLIETGVLAKRSSTTIVKGIDQEESAVVDYAAANKLCITSNSNHYYDGGTYGSWQAQILAHFGVSATDQFTTLDGIASAIKNNECVIAEVDAYKLWGMADPDGYPDHAITVTGVDYSLTNSSQIDGFYICDSGRGLASDAARFVSAGLMASVFDLYQYNGQAVGEAVITNNSKQALSSTSITSSIKGIANNIIQQMTAFAPAPADQIATAINENNKNQNLTNLIASHS